MPVKQITHDTAFNIDFVKQVDIDTQIVRLENGDLEEQPILCVRFLDCDGGFNFMRSAAARALIEMDLAGLDPDQTIFGKPGPLVDAKKKSKLKSVPKKDTPDNVTPIK